MTVNEHVRRRRFRGLARGAALTVAALGGVMVPAPPAAGAQDAASSGQPDGPPREVTITDRGTVRLHVVDEPLANVLQLLSVAAQRNIITSPQVKGSVTASLYDVTFEEALAAVLTPNGAGFRSAGKFVYVYTNHELKELERAGSPQPYTRVYRLNYLSAADAKTYIEPLIGEKGVVTAPPPAATGVGSDPEDAGGNTNAMQGFLLVTADPATHDLVRELLREIDARPKQALIEATILRAELTDDNALGIDFTLVGGVDLELLGASSTGITDLTLGQLPQVRFERFNANASTDFAGDVPSGGLTFGIIKDNVAVFLRALEEVTDTTVLANPKVLALNRQKGQVIVGRRDGFLTTTVTETQAIQTVEFLETGTQLIFRPFIGDDGFIRVELHPEDSVGFVNAQGLPSEQTTEVTTNVLVRDGETILIGGLFREVTTDARSQIPGLGSIPYLGALFGSRNESTSREEVIILMTIHVVKDHEAYSEASWRQYEDVERLRVGLRTGLMWHGRERLAQRHYHRAVAALDAGDADKALWHVNMALHNHGRMIEAIRLKERLTGHRAWEEDGSHIRSFLYHLIARERGYKLRPFDRPRPEVPLPSSEGQADGPPPGAGETTP